MSIRAIGWAIVALVVLAVVGLGFMVADAVVCAAPKDDTGAAPRPPLRPPIVALPPDYDAMPAIPIGPDGWIRAGGKDQTGNWYPIRVDGKGRVVCAPSVEGK